MARAVVPKIIPPIGPLPFTNSGTLKALDGATLAEGIPCRVWPASGRDGTRGKAIDHQGEAAIAFADALRLPNRKLEVLGVTYHVVDAVAHDLFRHVALKLRELKPGGGA